MLKLLPSSIQDLGKLVSGNVATKAIGIFVLAFYARVLTKEELAIFPIYGMLSGLTPVILSFGVKANLLKWLPSLLKKNMPEARRLVASSALLSVSGTVIVSGFVVIFSSTIMADVVAVTATALLNRTLPSILEPVRADAFVMMLGPSTPLTPALFDFGFDILCGTVIEDPEKVVRAVEQGAVTSQITGVRRVSLWNDKTTQRKGAKTQRRKEE